jgi:exodeoxyribonuclease V gamma subunit
LFAAVRHATESLSRPRTMPDWAAAIERTLEDLFAPQTKLDKAAMQSLRDCCRELRRLAALVADDEDDALVLSPAALREWLTNQLDGKREGTGFLSGSLTFASMRPMRSVPMRVIAICGLHDGSFPRSDKRHEFDLMADKRRHGDRSRREDDRQLFLDALLSAKEALVLTYVGRSSKDNAETAPSTVLSELLDHVDEAFTPPKGHARARDAVVVDHPLQSFSERYGDGEDPRLFTYAGNAPATRERARAEDAGIAAATAVGKKPVVALEDLVAFWKEPQRNYCLRVLQARFPEAVDEEQETEPFTLASLDRYAIAQEAVADALATGASAALPAAAQKTECYRQARWENSRAATPSATSRCSPTASARSTARCVRKSNSN